MTFAQFAKAVEAEVKNAGVGGVCVNSTSTSYRRGKLTVSLDEQLGRAMVSYSADPTHGGHSSSGSLPYDLTNDGVKLAAADVIAKLNNPYLYE